MAKSFVSKENFQKIWEKEKAYFQKQEAGKGLSTNDYDNTAKGKVDNLATVATSGSYNDLTDKPTIPEGAAASDTVPAMDGVASAGSETKFARGDHVHPSDTSRVPTTTTVNGKPLSSNITLTADDVSAIPNTRTVNGKPLSSNITLSANDVSAIPASAKGTANGVATLGSDGLVPSNQLPSYVDDVIEGYLNGGKFYKESAHTTEIPGESGKIYVDITNAESPVSYRYSGSAFVKIVSDDSIPLTNEEIDEIMV